uniref:Piezo_RRas_bdg domain-containing protein n=1 Tax=Toxocara canis TaxID=6265 RepID=A0A183V610_TOXCA
LSWILGLKRLYGSFYLHTIGKLFESRENDDERVPEFTYFTVALKRLCLGEYVAYRSVLAFE